MRWIGAVALLAVATAMPASGQLVWGGIADGTSWEWQAKTAPGDNFTNSKSSAPAAFVAFPVSENTLFRISAADVPHDVLYGGVAWTGVLHAYTVGTSYLLPGTFGQAVLSAGFGSYHQHLIARRPPPGFDQTKLGWYLGAGEWFPLTWRTRVTAEITMHKTPHQGGTTVFTATAGLAAWF